MSADVGLQAGGHDKSVSPVLAEFDRSLNNVLPDDKRQRLLPLARRMIGTAGDGLDEARGFLALDWLVRVYLPTWLRLIPGLVADADALAGFRAITDMGAAVEVGMLVWAAQKRADAAWNAA